jgi:phage N-6-adenine-methyltransferase
VSKAVATVTKLEPPTNRQNWATPPEFIEAVARRFGRPDFDLAASADNAKAEHYFTEKQDALRQDWTKPLGMSPRVCFLNPQYANIDPWAKKCAEVRLLPRWTLLLVPASVDSNWFEKHVHGKAHWFGLKGRITFLGAESSYMKPLMLAAYGFGVSGSSPWDWRKV